MSILKKYLAEEPESSDNLFNERKPYDPGFTYVDQYYEMDPATEVVAFDGSQLFEGAWVLIENPRLRGENPMRLYNNFNVVPAPELLEGVRLNNRWAQISQLEIDPEPKNGHHCTDRKVRFIATYDGGVQRKRVVDFDEAWLVKKSLTPEQINEIHHNSGIISEEEYEAKKKEIDEAAYQGFPSDVDRPLAELPEEGGSILEALRESGIVRADRDVCGVEGESLVSLFESGKITEEFYKAVSKAPEFRDCTFFVDSEGNFGAVKESRLPLENPLSPDWTPPQFDNVEWPAQHGSDESESKDH